MGLTDFFDFEDKVFKLILDWLSTILLYVLLQFTLCQHIPYYRLMTYILCGWLLCGCISKGIDYVAFNRLGFDTHIL